MHLIDVTNSYRRMVENQLSNTGAQLVKVYSLGNTTVIYTEFKRQIEVVISNKVRAVKKQEVDFVIDRFFKDYKDAVDILEDNVKRVYEITLNKVA